MSPFLRRAEDVHGTIQVPTVIASRKSRRSWKTGSNKRVEVDAGHVDGVADRSGLNEPLGHRDGERWQDSPVGSVPSRPTVAGRSFTMPQALSIPHAARGGTAGDIQPPVPT